MKILELTRLFYPSLGGMEKFVDDRLKIYQSLGYNYKVITTTNTEKQLEKAESVEGVQYLNCFTPYVITPGLKKVLNSDYDVLSVNEVGYFYSDYAVRQAYGQGKKIILTPHFSFHTNRFKRLKSIHKKYILPGSLKKVDKIISFTNCEKEFWLRNFPFVSEKIEIIPHYFKPSQTINEPGKICDNNFLLYLGRGGRNKRIDLLIEAFNQIEPNEFKLFLTIENNELTASLKELTNSNNNIKLLGRVSEIEKNRLLGLCSALVFPTDYEAFGIVNLEASYYKKPLIISNLNVFSDILDPDGVMYFENSITSIRKILEEYLKLNTVKKEEMGNVNFENLKRYSFERIENKYRELFNKLILS